MNILKALNNGYDLLKSSNINSYKIDTELLLSDSLNISREKLIINFKDEINMQSYRNFLIKINRRKKKRTYCIHNKKSGPKKNSLFLGYNFFNC